MDLKFIDQFINKNSTAASKSKSNYVYCKLISNSNDFFEFSCIGSASEPYTTIIELENNKIKATSCTCPYDYGGICKHSVASLKKLKKDITSGEILLLQGDVSPFQGKVNPFQPKVMKLQMEINDPNKLKGSQILLNNAIINFDEIKKTIINSNYGIEYMEIDSASPKKVETSIKGWYGSKQVFDFNKETNVLSTKCTCTKMEKLCDHRLSGLKLIIKTFGEDFFTENYFDNQIGHFLKQYGLSIKDDYSKYFEFSLTTKGIQQHSKYPNIAPIENASLYKTEETNLLAQLPYCEVTENKTKGIGVCFEMTKSNYRDLFPVEAKYNKAKTDFSSSFEEITFNNFEYHLSIFENDNDRNFVFKLLQIVKTIKRSQSTLSLESMQKAMRLFNEILPEFRSKFLYSYNPKNSLTRKNLEPLTIADAEIKLYFVLTETEFFYNLKAKIAIDDKNHNINAQKIIISPLFIIENTTIYPITSTDLSLSLQYYSKSPETNYLKNDFKNFNQKVLLPLAKKYEVQQSIFKKEKTNFEENGLEKHIYIKDLEGSYIIFDAAVLYNNIIVSVFSQELIFNDAENDPKKILFQERNKSFEDNFIEEIKSLHPAFENQENQFYLLPEQLFENYWMLHATERMKNLGIKVFGANELKSFRFNLNKPTISINLKSNIDWFDIEINITFGNQKVDLKELQKAFIKKSNFVSLVDGTLGILPEDWLRKFENYFKTGEIKKNSIQISNYQFGIIDELYNEMENKPTFLEELYQKKKRLQNISEIENIAIPKGIKAKLRDYQQHGLNWLAFLHKNQLGGCLADDMGLGKTLQTITFLHHLKTVEKNKVPSLIIAPTSLIFNWMSEVEKFCPTLKIHSFTGNARAGNTHNFNKFDVIISTYGSLLNDVEFLKDFNFNYIILDESQAIKNPNSKRYKAVRLLNSYNRLVLTGTPIENNTFDLYAQLNFLNPGLLGNMSHFKNNFSNAIDKEKNIDASILLSKIITPFVLRRTKENVAKELPDKTESIIYCEMGIEQRKVYEAFKNKYRDYLLNKIDENGVEKSQMYILEGLTKLRQICNSTALINDEADYGNYSAKLEILMENIKEKTGNHKILVFSQFVKMLQIVKTRLDEDHISYEYLDGKTKDRQDNVNNFQSNKNVRVFLISLRAGGTGLNLTEADYVFIIDPWWNPAVENQAIDRCYRIGQTKNVLAYRMICKDTLEEKIVSLQQKKKAVATSIISIDNEKKSFDVNEVKELFG
ncbi:MAG: DEAD/DEAH box helicase [Lutibacter sp.]|nr:DEAD/DEAH box helicase [Lutibacter sp.]